MVKMNRWILCIVLLLMLATPVCGKDMTLSTDSTLEGILSRGVLRVGFEAGYMPFEMIDTRGGMRQRSLIHADERRGGQQASFVGFDVDLAREMADALGVRLVTVNTRWPSIIPALKLGRFDIIISGMSVTEARQKEVDFSDAYMRVGQTILIAKKHAGRVQSYKDLNRKSFVVTSKPATTGEDAVRTLIPNCTYLPLDSEIACGRAVLDGKADAFVYDRPYHAIFMGIYAKDRLVWLDTPFTEENLACAIRKNDPDFLLWINRFLSEIRADGRYESIYTKWFENKDWYSFVR